jgi:3-mercaptopyruvate sulfurtransferase SseA
MDYRRAHIPGSRWSTRTRLAADTRGEKRTVVLSGEADVARLAASELMESGVEDVKLLAGGRAGWIKAGYPTEATPGSPPDAQCIDYLFFVHDRHAGNEEAMRQYLAWETGLLGQLDARDRAAFRIPAG